MTTYVWFVRGEAHAAMCRTSMESVRKVDPDAYCTVVTDDGSIVAGADHGTGIAEGLPIMVANLEAQITALLSRDAQAGGEFVFLDTDVLLLKPIPQIGELTITWRDHVLVADDGEKTEGLAAAMPYNYGVMSARRSQATVEAFIWVRERIRRMHPAQQKWYGNQLAMTELAGPRPTVGTSIDLRRIPWKIEQPSTSIAIGKIPCETYNFTPFHPAGTLNLSNPPKDPNEDKHALHFKGKSRHLMAAYAKFYGLGWYL